MAKRRDFLMQLSAGAAVVLSPGAAISATLDMFTDLDGGAGAAAQPPRAELASLLGYDLDVFDASGVTRAMRLSAVDAGPECPGLDQFSIVLEGSELTEGLYGISHPRIGTHLVGLAPSGQDSWRSRAHFARFA